MRFYFESYGCTMNQGEAKIMQDILRGNGHSIVDDMKNSDALVLVTCTVIETTELKMMKRLNDFSKTGKPVIVAGCMASVQKEQILNVNPDVIMIMPQDFKDIEKIADGLLKKGFVFDEKITEPILESRKTADAIIPISSGCLGSCTYCITRIARGELRSCSPEILIEGVKRAVQEGYKEIRLTSQDNAAYGIDIDTNLPALLNKIRNLRGDFRVRVGMMNPDNVKSILHDLVNTFKDPKIYKFLHLPVQSGSNRILDVMGRKYSVDDFLSIINNFRDNFQDITISTDIIVGFPGESEKDYKKSLELVKTLRPNILNITRFSARPRTKATEMPNRIPSRIAKERSRELTKVHTGISQVINDTFIGKKQRILITKPGKNGTMMGRTDSYKPVVVKEKVDLCKIVDVEITEASATYLEGRIL